MRWGPLSMFIEKGETPPVLSMTRVVAFIFAVTYCYALILFAQRGKDFGWPFCVLGVVTVLAVPLQAMFKYLQVWFTSSPGQKLLRDLLAKVSGATLTAPAASTTKTEVTTTTAAGANIDPTKGESGA